MSVSEGLKTTYKLSLRVHAELHLSPARTLALTSVVNWSPILVVLFAILATPLLLQSYYLNLFLRRGVHIMSTLGSMLVPSC